MTYRNKNCNIGWELSTVLEIHHKHFFLLICTVTGKLKKHSEVVIENIDFTLQVSYQRSSLDIARHTISIAELVNGLGSSHCSEMSPMT